MVLARKAEVCPGNEASSAQHFILRNVPSGFKSEKSGNLTQVSSNNFKVPSTSSSRRKQIKWVKYSSRFRARGAIAG